jgi:hypothetical protein
MSTGTLLQKSQFQCTDKAVGNSEGFAIDYALGGVAFAADLAVAIANDLVAAQTTGNPITLTIYTPTGIITRTVSYGSVEEYGGEIYRVQVTADSSVYIEFVLGPPPVTVRLQTIGITDIAPSSTVGIALPGSAIGPQSDGGTIETSAIPLTSSSVPAYAFIVILFFTLGETTTSVLIGNSTAQDAQMLALIQFGAPLILAVPPDTAIAVNKIYAITNGSCKYAVFWA